MRKPGGSMAAALVVSLALAGCADAPARKSAPAEVPVTSERFKVETSEAPAADSSPSVRPAVPQGAETSAPAATTGASMTIAIPPAP